MCVHGRFDGEGGDHGGDKGEECGLGRPFGEVREIDHTVCGIDVRMGGAKGHVGCRDDESKWWAVWMVGHEPDVDWDAVVCGFVGDGDGATEGEEGFWGGVMSAKRGESGMKGRVLTGSLSDVLEDVRLGVGGIRAGATEDGLEGGREEGGEGEGGSGGGTRH